MTVYAAADDTDGGEWEPNGPLPAGTAATIRELTEGDREPPPDPADYCPDCSDVLDSHSAAGCRLCACPRPGPFRSAPGT